MSPSDSCRRSRLNQRTAQFASVEQPAGRGRRDYEAVGWFFSAIFTIES